MEQEPDRTIQCGIHGTEAEIDDAEAGERSVTCPTCGQTDTLEFATAEAAKAELGGEIDRAIKDGSASDVMAPPPAGPRPRWVFGQP